jgi:hypothetical protein
VTVHPERVTKATAFILSSTFLIATQKFGLPLEPFLRQTVDRLRPVAERATGSHQAGTGQLAVGLAGGVVNVELPSSFDVPTKQGQGGFGEGDGGVHKWESTNPWESWKGWIP